MNQLDARDVTWLMPAVKNGAIKEEIAKFERGERGPYPSTRSDPARYLPSSP